MPNSSSVRAVCGPLRERANRLATEPSEAAMIERRSLEDALAEFDEIMRRYRRGIATPSAPNILTRDEAIAQLMRLRFTAGEALRLLHHHSVK
jgi:hypothetical protein